MSNPDKEYLLRQKILKQKILNQKVLKQKFLKQKVLKQTEQYVKTKLSGEGSGHDWWHVYRVDKLAVHICKKEGANLYIVRLAALLHDISDWKFSGGDDSAGPKAAEEWLISIGVDFQDITHICQIIKDLSFKGAGVKTPMKTKEGMIVQDADRLDAIGAIGIARAFAYGGHAGREIYNPEISPVIHSSFEHYKKSKGTSLNHFYEKLFLLKKRMNTKTAKSIAQKRHKYMEQYVKRFLKEWEGKA